jgi:hypothetical protein
MPDGRSRYSERTLALMRRTRRRQETDLKLEIRHNGEPSAGETFEFVVSSKRRLARVAAYLDRSRIWEAGSVEPPHTQRIFIPLNAAGQTLRIRVVDDIGNAIEEQLAIRKWERREETFDGGQ